MSLYIPAGYYVAEKHIGFHTVQEYRKLPASAYTLCPLPYPDMVHYSSLWHVEPEILGYVLFNRGGPVNECLIYLVHMRQN